MEFPKEDTNFKDSLIDHTIEIRLGAYSDSISELEVNEVSVLLKMLTFYIEDSNSMIMNITNNQSTFEDSISNITTYSEAIISLVNDFLHETVFKDHALSENAVQHPLTFKMLLQEAINYYTRILQFLNSCGDVINYLKTPT